MTTFTGKLLFVNLAAAGKKSDSIVLDTAEGKQQRIYLKMGEANSLLPHKGKVISAVTTAQNTKDGTTFYWSSQDKISVVGGTAQTSSPGSPMQDVDRNLSINYQSARKDAILALVHNTGKGQITPLMIHEFTLELAKFALSRDLGKQVFAGKTDKVVADDDFELNDTGTY